ncbi:MAG: fatty acid desaturase family protein [Bacteroidota bacterium]
MKTIKFSNKNNTNFSAALKKNVNDYFTANGITKKGNTGTVMKSVVMITLFLAPFVVMLTVPLSGWVIFPLSVMMGIGMSGIGMSVMHDAVHGSLSRKGWMNSLLSNTMYLLGGNVFTWKVQHNLLHHTFTNIEGFDQDIDSRSIFRFSPRVPLKKIHRLQFIYAFFFYSLMSISKLFMDFFNLHKYNRRGIVKDQKTTAGFEYSRMILSKLAYFFVAIGFPLLFSSFSWWMILIGFLVMHLTAGIIMSVIFQLAHVVEGTDLTVPDKDGNIETEWAIHELQTTSNFARNNRLLTWYVGGLNFQIEHHLFPHICHIHYKNISPIVEQTAKEFGLSYNLKPSFTHAILSHIRVLKALGNK